MRFQKMGDRIVPCGPEANEWYANAKDGDSINLQVERRTDKQNSSLQVWCRMCAQFCREAGIDLKALLREGAEIPVTEHAFKDQIWRPVQEAMTGHTSTTKPSPAEYPLISETIIRHVANRCEVTLPDWPCKESMRDAA